MYFPLISKKTFLSQKVSMTLRQCIIWFSCVLKWTRKQDYLFFVFLRTGLQYQMMTHVVRSARISWYWLFNFTVHFKALYITEHFIYLNVWHVKMEGSYEQNILLDDSAQFITLRILSFSIGKKYIDLVLYNV